MDHIEYLVLKYLRELNISGEDGFLEADVGFGCIGFTRVPSSWSSIQPNPISEHEKWKLSYSQRNFAYVQECR